MLYKNIADCAKNAVVGGIMHLIQPGEVINLSPNDLRSSGGVIRYFEAVHKEKEIADFMFFRAVHKDEAK